MANELELKRPSFLKGQEGNLGVEGMEDQVQYAKLKLAQGTTRDVPEDINAGEFFDTDGHGYKKSVVIVPIMYWKTRVMFDEALEVVCRSADGLVPNVGMLSERCATCPHAKWTKNAEGIDEKPECMISYNYAVYTEQQLKKIAKGEQILPLMFTGSRAALKPLKRLNAIAKKNALQSGIPLYLQTFKLKAEKQEGKFVYYTYNIQFNGLIEDENLYQFLKKTNGELQNAKEQITTSHIEEVDGNTVKEVQRDTAVSNGAKKTEDEDIPF